MIQIGNPQFDMAKLQQLDQQIVAANRGGAAGQSAAS